jgi:hypothetical protein
MSQRHSVPNLGDSSHHVLLVQLIRTTWSKASRGGRAAAARNAVPETFLVPNLPSQSESTTVVHTLEFAEVNQFELPTYTNVTSTPSIGKMRLHSIAIYPASQSIRIAAEWLLLAGAPRRRPIANLVELASQTWVQIRYNLRTGLDEGWAYYKYVFNIGYFSSLPLEAFTTTVPKTIKSFLYDLW